MSWRERVLPKSLRAPGVPAGICCIIGDPMTTLARPSRSRPDLHRQQSYRTRSPIVLRKKIWLFIGDPEAGQRSESSQ